MASGYEIDAVINRWGFVNVAAEAENAAGRESATTDAVAGEVIAAFEGQHPVALDVVIAAPQ